MPNNSNKEKNNSGTQIPIYIERENTEVEIPISPEEDDDENRAGSDEHGALTNLVSQLEQAKPQLSLNQNNEGNQTIRCGEIASGAMTADIAINNTEQAQAVFVSNDAVVQEYLVQPDDVSNKVSPVFNRIDFGKLGEFLSSLRVYLKKQQGQSTEIAAVCAVIDKFLSNKKWQNKDAKRLTESQEHLLVRDLFDDMRDLLTKKGDQKGQKQNIKLLFKILKSYHLAAGAASILQAYIDKACKKNEKYAPSFNQALPSATLVNAQSAKVKGGGGVNVPGGEKATLTGSIAFSKAKTKNIAMDSAYSVEKDLSVTAAFEADAGFSVPGLAQLKFNAKASVTATLVNYQEQTSITGFILLNFTDKHAWFGQYMSGTVGREIADKSRKISNIYRRFRGVPTVVRDAPYFLTQTKVYLGSGSKRLLLEIATTIDHDFKIEPNDPNSLSGLMNKYYPQSLDYLVDQQGNVNEALSDVNKAYGLLSSGSFNPKDAGVGIKNTARSWVKPTDLRTHEAGYSGRNYSGDLSFDFKFKVGVGADNGLMFYGEPAGDGKGQAGHQDSQSKKLSSVIPSLVTIGAHLDAGISWLSIPVGANTLLCDAFNVHDKTPGGARRAMTRVLETLIDNDVLEYKTALLTDQKWIAELKKAIMADRKTSIKKPQSKDIDSSSLRDAKLLKHGAENVKKVLNDQKSKSSNGLINQNLESLLTQLQSFYQDHLALKRLQFFLIKEPDYLGGREKTEEQMKARVEKMIERYWKVQKGSAIYDRLLSDAMSTGDIDNKGALGAIKEIKNQAKQAIKDKLNIKNPTKQQVQMGQVFIARTLDNFDLCLAMLGMQITALKMADKPVSEETIKKYRAIRSLIDGGLFEVDKKTLREYSSVMMTAYIKDVRLVMNAALKFEGPALGLVSKAFSSVSAPEIELGGGPVAGIAGNVRFEVYNRYEFPNEVRKGLFIKVVLDTKLSGVVAYLPYVLCKAVETFQAQRAYQSQLQKILNRIGTSLTPVAQILLNPHVFTPNIGAGVEMIFRVSQERGWEWLNTKYLTTYESDLSVGTPNVLAAVPGATLTFSGSDYKKVIDIKQYRLGNGLMSHFTTWRRELNNKKGTAHSSVQAVLRSFYSDQEWQDASKVTALADPNMIKNRKDQLAEYQLDTELFSNDCVAWIIQRYLNAYSGRIEILTSAVGRDDLAGQIGRFFGDSTSRIFQDAIDRLKLKQQEKYAVDPQRVGLIFEEISTQDREKMLELLQKYRQRIDKQFELPDEYKDKNPAVKIAKTITKPIQESWTSSVQAKKDELKENVDYFLSTKEGRQLFLYYMKILSAVDCITNFVAREDNMCYSPTIDGIPGSSSSKKIKQSDQETKASLKEALIQFKNSKLELDQAEDAADVELETTPKRVVGKTFINKDGEMETLV